MGGVGVVGGCANGTDVDTNETVEDEIVTVAMDFYEKFHGRKGNGKAAKKTNS